MKEEDESVRVQGGFIDKNISKLVSRKLLVWSTATAALFFGLVPPSDWVNISVIYIGGQAVVDAVALLRG